MMKAKAMPAEFWGEAVSTAVFILNRSPTKALKGMTPYEAWHGRKPNVSYLRTFGCIGHMKIVKPGLGKLEDRSTKMVFLGYEDGTKAYRLYDPARGKVVVSRDVVFDEAAAWRWDTSAMREAEGTGGGLTGEFVVEQLVIERQRRSQGRRRWSRQVLARRRFRQVLARRAQRPQPPLFFKTRGTRQRRRTLSSHPPVHLLGVRGCLPRRRGAPIQAGGRRHR